MEIQEGEVALESNDPDATPYSYPGDIISAVYYSDNKIIKIEYSTDNIVVTTLYFKKDGENLRYPTRAEIDVANTWEQLKKYNTNGCAGMYYNSAITELRNEHDSAFGGPLFYNGYTWEYDGNLILCSFTKYLEGLDGYRDYTNWVVAVSIIVDDIVFLTQVRLEEAGSSQYDKIPKDYQTEKRHYNLISPIYVKEDNEDGNNDANPYIMLPGIFRYVRRHDNVFKIHNWYEREVLYVDGEKIIPERERRSQDTHYGIIKPQPACEVKETTV